jgi:hypothetical protein
MKIKLTQGQFTLVDEEDFNYLNQWKWHLGKGGYAYRRKYLSDGKDGFVSVYMHRLLLNPPPGMEIDHINGNGLDNHRANLRIVTHQQNSINHKVRCDNQSGLSGVYFDKHRKKWVSEMWLDTQKIFGARFEYFDDAVLIRSVLEDIYFGKYKRKPVIFTLEE